MQESNPILKETFLSVHAEVASQVKSKNALGRF